jgi:hypothetical protein
MHDGVRWSIPGDWAEVEADGTLKLYGRGSQCINTGGEKVYPEEVEEALKTHPTVNDAAVVGVPDDRFGEAITALVEPHAGDTIDEAALIAHVRLHLAAFKSPKRVLPKRVFTIDTIGRAANGKLGAEPLHVLQQASLGLAQLEAALCVVDRRLDLAAMAHDARVAEQSLHVAVVVGGDARRVEAVERGTEVVALAQDREPRQARLEPFQAQLLEQPGVVGDLPAPLVVVVVRVQRIVAAPPAASSAVETGAQVRIHRLSLAAGCAMPGGEVHRACGAA